jgi:hypothetical protein
MVNARSAATNCMPKRVRFIDAKQWPPLILDEGDRYHRELAERDGRLPLPVGTIFLYSAQPVTRAGQPARHEA